jgi:16S rRNA (adenine1518-N6/adenine1519-N6)-dimethyltransferase
METVRPKKHLGQHFLTDGGTARKIVERLQPLPDELVLEIGPGKGVLTQLLVAQGHRTLAVEYDAESVAYLAQHLPSPLLTVAQADVLAYDFPQQPLALIGNLPYNISSPIFFKILENRAHIRRAVVMIQREVAERIAAPPGSKTYGILSVLVGYYYAVKYEFTVPPGAFFPPPKVHSGVISLERRNLMETVPYEAFCKVVKAAFGQRRKTLRNALASIGFVPPAEIAPLRAEQIAIADFARLTNLYLSTR